jgi:hypothetical protein
MATTLQKGLFGGDPVEMQMQQQKLWQSAYAGAQNPYEKIGIALGQLGSTFLGGETAFQSKTKAINEAIASAGQLYQAGTAEYYKAIADSLPSEYSDSKEFATQKYIEVKKAETTAYTDAIKAIKDNPELAPTFTDPLKNSLLQKAVKNGWNEADVPLPQTNDEIKDFAKQFKLDKDPMYRQFMSMNMVAEKEAKKEVMESEKSLLTMESIRTTIAKNKKEMNKIDSDKFEAGARWNEERNSAISLFDANKLDPRQPLKGVNLANTELVNAQRIALRDPWTGKSGATIRQPGETAPPPAGGKSAATGGDIGQQVTTAFGSYEPSKYEYRIVNGQVQRKAK